MRTEIDYSVINDRIEADVAAIRDLRVYLGEDRFQLVAESFRKATKVDEVRFLIHALDIMAGVSGRPVQALARRECLALFREFMHSDPYPVPTDEAGFILEMAERVEMAEQERAPATWQLAPGVTIEMLGLLPEIFDASDPKPAETQIDLHYAHGGGYAPLRGWKPGPNFAIEYPGDPDFLPLASLTLASGETIRVYDCAWVGIWHGDVLTGVTRMD